MTDRQLKYITVLAEEGNMTSAARKLFISQPSLSSMLSHLEQELGILLFDRDTDPLRPTYAGECYLAAAKEILDIQQGLYAQIHELRQANKGKLIIGCGSRLLPVILPRLLPSFMKKYPEIQIQIIENRSNELKKMLDEGELDLMFVSRPLEAQDFGSVSLYSEDLLLYTPADFLTPDQINALGTVDLALLKDAPFALMNTSSVREMTDTIFQSYGFSPLVILESSSWEICISMVSAGIACTILPGLNHSDRGIECNHMSKPFFRNINIYYRKNYCSPLIMEAFLEHCRSLYPSHA